MVALLIFVFVASVSAVVAEDTGDADELAIDDVDESVAVSNVADEPLAVDESEETLAAGENDDTLAAGEENSTAGDDAPTLASVGVNVEVLDKNIKVGDKFKVKVTVVNSGEITAKNVIVGLGYSDLLENPDATFKLLDAGIYDAQDAETGWEIYLDDMEPGVTHEIILTFLATESGTKYFGAAVNADNSNPEPDSQSNTTVTIGENQNSASSSANNKSKAVASKTLHATGNPLALLALALFGIVPYYRRN